MRDGTLRSTIDAVLGAIDVHRDQLVNRLFPEANDTYRDEWRQIGEASRFWRRLDLENQRRVIDIARDIYAEE